VRPFVGLAVAHEQHARIVAAQILQQRLLHQRVETLNLIIDDISSLLGAKCLDVREINIAYDKAMWHVDRMHPSRFGYHVLARHFADLLSYDGHQVRDVTAPIVRPRSRRENLQWMMRMGLPWFLKRCKDLFPGVGYLLVLETSKDVARALRKRRNQSASPDLSRQPWRRPVSTAPESRPESQPDAPLGIAA
jgi:hypothetical protein